MTKENNYIFGANAVFIEELYKNYLVDKNSVSTDWANFFESVYENSQVSGVRSAVKVVGGPDYDVSSMSYPEAPKKKKDETKQVVIEDFGVKVNLLISNFVNFGYLESKLDPLGIDLPVASDKLTLFAAGLTGNEEIDMNGRFGLGKCKTSDLYLKLRQLYSSKIAVEVGHISDDNKRNWVIDNYEKISNKVFTATEKEKILSDCVNTEYFEKFIGKKFTGAKRFSVEGGDALIPATEKIVEFLAGNGVKKLIIGIAHRGRLNMLANVVKKPYHAILGEFAGVPSMPSDITKSGDVKYHMGHSTDRILNGNKIRLSLAFNPSHLEAVNSVVNGRTRATQDSFGNAASLLVHGDAAFSGQGSVYESIMMSKIKGYDVGGTIHIIVNNQIGFTANKEDSRSTRFCSDLGKAMEIPIFHVNGDDVEGVVKVAELLARYRQEFQTDVILDIVCYRKHGHNEMDEPFFTQPIMYNKIKIHPTLCEIYSKNSGLPLDKFEKIKSEFEALLEDEFQKSKDYAVREGQWLKENWAKIKHDTNDSPITGCDEKFLKSLGEAICKIPDGFNINPKIARQVAARLESINNGKNIDWGTGEALAFASLLSEKHSIRISGQDSGRGTFSHRHSVWHDGENGSEYVALNNISKDQAKYYVYDSILSEYAVLGFEYGYSLDAPNSLVIWEAQFGDFANGAQIIFDQFISSGEMKWLRKSGLVCLLPHGYEGQGPEHSSARLERFLQLTGDDNMRIVNCTNPANLFHVLRRQIKSKDRKPLIVMSPKSLLRHPLCISNLADFSGNTKFQEVIGEIDEIKNVKKVVITSGKIYYDLLQKRRERSIFDIVIIRLEQYYPFPTEKLQAELSKYKSAEIIYCQEEPKNMGSYNFVRDYIEDITSTKLKYFGRKASASPATGYPKYHDAEQSEIVSDALGLV